MANDREVLKEVWEGKIPIKFIICPSDRGWYDFPKLLYTV